MLKCCVEWESVGSDLDVCLPDGQFPINLSRIQVEKDHSFLDQADIDTLVRRLNILNRCADKMDEIRNLVRELLAFSDTSLVPEAFLY